MKFDKEHDLLIVPDVHGRDFWREPVMGGHYEHVVFLGDYTDPYPQEYIENDEAVEVFREIINFAEDHPGRVTLLLGNHDMHYVSDTFERRAKGSRYAFSLHRPMVKLYQMHQHLFTLAIEADYEGRHCLITHAGVASGWLEKHKEIVGEPTADNINRLMDSDEGIIALADIGWSRGGWAKVGGPMWADCSELMESEPLPGVFQIFGHTQNFERQPVITPYLACLDCHRTFLLSEVLQMADQAAASEQDGIK